MSKKHSSRSVPVMGERPPAVSRAARRSRRMLGLTGSLIVCSVALIACDQEATIKAQIDPRLPAGFIKTSFRVASAKMSGVFTKEHTEASLECSVTVIGHDPGRPEPVVKVVHTKIVAKGTPGGKYELDCSDPLIAQFPDDASDFKAVARDGASVIILPVIAGLSSVQILPGQTLDAEPGTQLIVIEYPPGMAAGFYELDLDFTLDSSRDIEVKPVIAAKVICDGEVYLPPIIPQVLSMADVPPVTIPVSPDLVDILPDVSGVAEIVSIEIDCGGGCYADCDGDGALTFFDFLCFQDAFASGSPGADCDGDGALTFFDFLCFQNAFAAGCP